jgi:hypothetical protein
MAGIQARALDRELKKESAEPLAAFVEAVRHA